MKNIIASINFEERTDKKAVNSNDTFKVWMSSTINQDIYSTTLITGLSFTKISDFEYDVTADNTGFNKISLQIQNKDKSKTSVSNTLLAIVG